MVPVKPIFRSIHDILSADYNSGVPLVAFTPCSREKSKQFVKKHYFEAAAKAKDAEALKKDLADAALRNASAIGRDAFAQSTANTLAKVRKSQVEGKKEDAYSVNEEI